MHWDTQFSEEDASRQLKDVKNIKQQGTVKSVKTILWSIQVIAFHKTWIWILVLLPSSRPEMVSAKLLDVMLLLNSAALNAERDINYYLQEAAKKKDIFSAAKNIEIMDFVKFVLLLSTLKAMATVFQLNVQRLKMANAMSVLKDSI